MTYDSTVCNDMRAYWAARAPVKSDRTADWAATRGAGFVVNVVTAR